MRRDLLIWGLAVFVVGLVLTLAIPDGTDSGLRSARDTTTGATTTNSVSWGDWVGWLAMLVGVGLAITGLFTDTRVTHRSR